MEWGVLECFYYKIEGLEARFGDLRVKFGVLRCFIVKSSVLCCFKGVFEVF
jgi:hypothetical protein